MIKIAIMSRMTKLKRCLIFIPSAVLSLIVSSGIFAVSPSTLMRPNLEIVVTKSKTDCLDGSDYDNRQQVFEFTVKIKNKDLSKNLENLSAELYVVGKYVTSNEYVLLDKATSSFGLPRGKEHSFKGSPIELSYDDNQAARFGVKYNGYVVFVQDQDGNILAEKGNKTSFLKYMDKLRNLSKEQRFNKQLDITD